MFHELGSRTEFGIGLWVRDRLGGDQEVLKLGGHPQEVREAALRKGYSIKGRRIRTVVAVRMMAGRRVLREGEGECLCSLCRGSESEDRDWTDTPSLQIQSKR